MLWFVTLTQECNYKCTYCGSSENEDIEDIMSIPKNIIYDLNQLKKLSHDPDMIICFYGGEPLLCMDEIKKIMEIVPHAKFVLQTNASLLDKLPDEQLHKMDTILVSVDGDSDRTNLNRGKNTYERSIRNVRDARDRGYKGDVIARMTVGPHSTIYEDVTHLLELIHDNKNLFDHVHWQLNVQWDTPAYSVYEYNDMNFFKWRDEIYNPGISKLVDDFIYNLREHNKILGIVPILGILWSYLSNEKFETVRCESGWNSFNVTTAGDITACPIVTETDIITNIKDIEKPQQLRHHEKVGEPCTSCEVLSECGGRCLYCNKTQWWDEEGLLEVCVTIKHLLKEIKTRILPVALEKIQQEELKLEDFHYPKYNNSTEIIP